MTNKGKRALEIIQLNPKNHIQHYEGDATAVVWAANVNTIPGRTKYPDDSWYGVWDEITKEDFEELSSSGLLVELYPEKGWVSKFYGAKITV